MSNYSDNPSMDEILKRIKKALAERERRVEEEAFSGNVEAREEAFVRPSSPVHFEVVEDRAVESEREQRVAPVSDGTSNVSDAGQSEIFIKPNLRSSRESDVFVLTKEMKVNSSAQFAELDFPKLFKNISVQMSKDLAMGYMAPKIESWLNNNFLEISTKSKKN